MQHTLRALSGPQAGALFVLTQRTTVGRASDCDIQIVHPGVSRRHAKITREDDGGMVIVDLSSDNGTFVGQVPIGRHRLRPGDIIRIVSVRFAYEQTNTGSAVTSEVYRQKTTSGDSLRQTAEQRLSVPRMRSPGKVRPAPLADHRDGRGHAARSYEPRANRLAPSNRSAVDSWSAPGSAKPLVPSPIPMGSVCIPSLRSPTSNGPAVFDRSEAISSSSGVARSAERSVEVPPDADPAHDRPSPRPMPRRLTAEYGQVNGALLPRAREQAAESMPGVDSKGSTDLGFEDTIRLWRSETNRPKNDIGRFPRPAAVREPDKGRDHAQVMAHPVVNRGVPAERHQGGEPVREHLDREYGYRNGLESVVRILDYKELRGRILRGTPVDSTHYAALESQLQQSSVRGEDPRTHRRYRRFASAIPSQLTHTSQSAAEGSSTCDIAVAIEDISVGGAKITFDETTIEIGDVVWLSIDLQDADCTETTIPSSRAVVLKARVIWTEPYETQLGIMFTGAPRYIALDGD